MGVDTILLRKGDLKLWGFYLAQIIADRQPFNGQGLESVPFMGETGLSASGYPIEMVLRVWRKTCWLKDMQLYSVK